MEYASINTAKNYSIEGRNKLQKDFEHEIKSTSFCIVTTGSYARDEASEASDLDCFIITIDKIDEKYFHTESGSIKSNTEFKDLINEIVKRYVKKEAGDTGTFGLQAIVKLNELTTNIGGTKDSNIQFTRRMLFLLEGKCLYNDELFNNFRKKLIEEYIKPTVSDHQLSRFFLNDIIRFYRTMTTDFEHKVSEKGKSRGVRNIKLTFSRKLLYFGGVITVAETAQKTRNIKITETIKLLDMSPLERIKYISTYRVDKVFKSYDYFLEKISDSEIRTKLDKANIENSAEKNPAIFRELKNESKHFSWALASLLKQTYDKTHPIHHALIL